MDLPVGEEKMAFLLDEDYGRQSKRKKFRRGFSRLVKGVFFQQSSTKKTRSKKSGEAKSTPDCHISSKIQKAFKFKKTQSSAPAGGESSPSDGCLGRSSNSSSVFSPSESSSTPSMSNSRSGSERKASELAESNMIKPLKNKDKYISVKKNYDCNIGLYFLLICLVGLVFCGKAFAIFCTATCLFFIPSRRRGVNCADSSLDFDYDQEHKRKVTMQGLRQRNRSP